MTKHRTQVLLEEWQFQLLEQRAAKAGKSVSDLIRGLVDESLAGPAAKPGLKGVSGLFDDGLRGRDHDRELYG